MSAHGYSIAEPHITSPRTWTIGATPTRRRSGNCGWLHHANHTHRFNIYIPTSSKTLKLDDVLCVPNVNKNLISVYRLCNANKVFVEFFPAHFQVKDLSSGVQLLHSRTKGDLYEWPKPNLNQSAYSTYPDTKATMDRWHNTLCHPSLATLKFVVSKFSLLCLNTASSIFPCNECLLNKTHKLPFSAKHNQIF